MEVKVTNEGVDIYSHRPFEESDLVGQPTIQVFPVNSITFGNGKESPEYWPLQILINFSERIESITFYEWDEEKGYGKNIGSLKVEYIKRIVNELKEKNK